MVGPLLDNLRTQSNWILHDEYVCCTRHKSFLDACEIKGGSDPIMHTWNAATRTSSEFENAPSADDLISAYPADMTSMWDSKLDHRATSHDLGAEK